MKDPRQNEEASVLHQQVEPSLTPGDRPTDDLVSLGDLECRGDKDQHRQQPTVTVVDAVAADVSPWPNDEVTTDSRRQLHTS